MNNRHAAGAARPPLACALDQLAIAADALARAADQLDQAARSGPPIVGGTVPAHAARQLAAGEAAMRGAAGAFPAPHPSLAAAGASAASEGEQ